MSKIKKNTEYTFKYNINAGRHGWLRLTPAYSVKVVEEVLKKLSYKPKMILEPFSGTGTTELVCANNGFCSTAYDINPFLVWVANVKTRKYTEEDNLNYYNAVHQIIGNIQDYEEADYPNIHNIERWWNPMQLKFLAKLKTVIWNEQNVNVKDLLKMSFCRTLIEVSNASFSHVSTSFKDNTEEDNFTFSQGEDIFLQICKMIAKTASINPVAKSTVINRDSKNIGDELKENFDTLITSPPYPNRISYIRELRPYMYWLGYIESSNDASELDWNTIGGTWGAATSKLSDWEVSSEILPDYLFDITNKIAKEDNRSANLMAKYVLKYFNDMSFHFSSVMESIVEGGTVHYIVGNSNFYGNSVPSDKLYEDLLKTVGFRNVKTEIIRKRNCNKELFEYLISAEK